MNKSRAILVLGMHRSGTSVYTKILNVLGIWLGNPENLLPAASDNPEGYWEHAKAVEIHESIFKILGRTWDCTLPMPENWQDLSEIKAKKSELKELICNELAIEPIWAVKDPRLCLLYPLWEEILNELDIEFSYLIPYRHPIDVSKSLGKRNRMSEWQAQRLWGLYTISAIQTIKDSKSLICGYSNLLNDFDKMFASINKFCAVECTCQLLTDAKGVVKDKLCHSLTSDEEIIENSLINEVWQTIIGINEGNSDYLTEKIRLLKNEFDFMYKQDVLSDYFHVYFSYEEGICKENVLLYTTLNGAELNSLTFRLQGNQAKQIRIDPTMFFGILNFKKFEILLDGSLLVDIKPLFSQVILASEGIVYDDQGMDNIIAVYDRSCIVMDLSSLIPENNTDVEFKIEFINKSLPKEQMHTIDEIIGKKLKKIEEMRKQIEMNDSENMIQNQRLMELLDELKLDKENNLLLTENNKILCTEIEVLKYEIAEIRKSRWFKVGKYLRMLVSK